MMFEASTTLLRKIAAVSLLFLFVALGWMVVAQPLIAHFANRAHSVEFERERYEKLAARRPNIPLLQRKRKTLASEQAATRVLLGEQTEQLAAAALQGEIKKLVADHNGSINRVTFLPSETEQGLTRVGLQFASSLVEAKLLPILRALEAREPFLFVSYARLRSKVSKANSKRLPKVDFEIRLHGYMKNKE